jgi:hypothetical protein
MSKRRRDETWIGVVSLLADERFALARVRRKDEWLADAGIAARGEEVAELARLYLGAVEARGYPPATLNLRAAAHAAALREHIGPGVPIAVGFDAKAEALSDAAAAAAEIAHAAEAAISADDIDGHADDEDDEDGGDQEYDLLDEIEPAMTSTRGPSRAG